MMTPQTIRTAAPLVSFFVALAVAAQPLRIEPVQVSLPGGTARGYYAEVDLLDPRVSIVTTGGTFCGNACFVPLVPVDDWFIQNDVDLAINANYFASIGGGQGQLLGLSVTEGTLVSNPRQVSGTYDPALGILASGGAIAGRLDPAAAATLSHGVAGIGPGSGDSLPGSLLVDDGVNLGSTARVSPLSREPRTVMGVSQDGGTLHIAVIDGRQPGYSVGMTLPEVADFLINRGVWDAVNLDGGGSSSFVYRTESGAAATNSPSDGFFRSVANHFGVRVEEAGTPAAGHGPRPIRGVWLRPPASLATLEARVAVLAEAGITDLFLETLYHGLATNDSDVFNDRFAFDYLDEAIIIAHRYGMRVHAWIETGYLGFGGSADYIFDAHPEWRVEDVNGIAPQGDQPGQTFANLAHPGVQQMLAEYVAELAAKPGLEGIHIDYHRYPVDNATTPESPAPYSYDAYTATAFASAGFGFPGFTARKPGDPEWDEFVQFRRDGISKCAEVMFDAINAVSPGHVYSAAIFASATTNASQLSKMQDWPAWANGGYMEVIIPMAYGPTQSSIRSDLQLAASLAPTTPIVAGLALTGTSPHPDVATQLGAVTQAGLDEFVFFEANFLAADAGELAALRSWVDQAPLQQGDLNGDSLVDGRDLAVFWSVYQGSPVNATGRNRELDFDESGVIDDADERALLGLFVQGRYGVDGVVDQADFEAFEASFTGPGTGGPVGAVINLHDLDADGDVDADDRQFFYSLVTVPLDPDLDVNRDGAFDIEDLYAQTQDPIDANRDGIVDQADTDRVIFEYRLLTDQQTDPR